MRAVLALVTAAVLLPSPPAFAGDEEPEPTACVAAAVAAIQKRYETVRDLSARFAQSSRSVALGRAGSSATSRGSVVFAKPGRMRWHYQEPDESLVVSDGHWLWIYDPFHREAQKLEVGGAWLSGAAIQFLLGEGKLLRDFRVSAERCNEEQALLVLVPRSASTYEELRLEADARSGDIRATEVRDLLGNVTRVAFEDVQINTDPKAELFAFEAPEGVRVIELATPPGQ
ncbi:MAG: outer membrane lipoprotein carrier protein LolA [Myxococcota bacterium]|nr:outer membrane lipoprotein carrier protein LolA [Myxococcota bacterium]